MKWLRIEFSGGLCDELPSSTELKKSQILGQVSNYYVVKED